MARIFCDIADIGKTTTAKAYQLSQKNVYYIDGSRNKTRSQFLVAIAKAVGVGVNANLRTIFEDIVFIIQATTRPMIIIDEAGDLSYEAWLEIKALWNALEGVCGWYMMGADGLKKKIEGGLRTKKVGYAEIFRRFGSGYMKASPDNPATERVWLRSQAEAVAHANKPAGSETEQFVKNTLSLTRIKENINKAKAVMVDAE